MHRLLRTVLLLQAMNQKKKKQRLQKQKESLK